MNERIKEIKEVVLSRAWATLKQYSYQWKTFKGPWQEQTREVYDRGNGVAVLMYNSLSEKIMLTRQFRMPTWLNGNNSGILLEVPAGVLDTKNPETCIIREIEEETGYQVEQVEYLFEAYTSPGAVTEKLYFFSCDYASATRLHEGGGCAGETEDIQVVEYTFSEVREMMKKSSVQDAKTLLLLQYGIANGLI